MNTDLVRSTVSNPSIPPMTPPANPQVNESVPPQVTEPVTEPVTPQLTRFDPTTPPRAAILMLHGGKARSTEPVTGRSLSWRRSLVMQQSIARSALDRGVSVWLLRYAVAGWNAEAPGGPTPPPDARNALAHLKSELGAVPVVLLGHSMGARTAVAVADDPEVTGVIALAPWFPPDEPVRALAGKHLVAAHGRRDRITSFAHTQAYVERASQVAASARMIDMGSRGHYLISGSYIWNDIALSHSFALLEAALETVSDA
jgi:alpha-beta hydrolase superfamily lysophospholipase